MSSHAVNLCLIKVLRSDMILGLAKGDLDFSNAFVKLSLYHKFPYWFLIDEIPIHNGNKKIKSSQNIHIAYVYMPVSYGLLG